MNEEKQGGALFAVVFVSLFVILASGGALLQYFKSTNSEIKLSPMQASATVDRDEHGCYIPGGFTWCSLKTKCLRVWEEPCEYTEEESGVSTDGIKHIPLEDAAQIAQKSECSKDGTFLLDKRWYNEFTRTWWISMETKKQGCDAACVVSEETLTAKTQWMCSGFMAR